MNTEEKSMLLHYLMIDIRIEPVNATKRMKYAIQLAEEIGHYAIPRRLTAMLDFTYADLLHGRALQVSFVYGGFLGLENTYDFPPLIMERSRKFQKKALKYLRNPSKLFVDVK